MTGRIIMGFGSTIIETCTSKASEIEVRRRIMRHHRKANSWSKDLGALVSTQGTRPGIRPGCFHRCVYDPRDVVRNHHMLTFLFLHYRKNHRAGRQGHGGSDARCHLILGLGVMDSCHRLFGKPATKHLLHMVGSHTARMGSYSHRPTARHEIKAIQRNTGHEQWTEIHVDDQPRPAPLYRLQHLAGHQ